MLSSILFLVLSLFIFRRSLLILQRDIFPQDEDINSGCRQRLGSFSGLMIWFSAGVIAFTTSIGGFIERLILMLQ